MRIYNSVEAIYRSFFSRDLYKDIGQNWRGVGFLYLFILLALCWVPLTYNFHLALKGLSKYRTAGIVQQIPTITVSKGLISIDKSSPYVIVDPKTNQQIAVFNTSMRSNEFNQVLTPIFITKDAVIIRVNNKSSQIYHVSQNETWHFTAQDFMRLTSMPVRIILIMLYYFVALFCSFLVRVIILLFYAFIGFIITKIFDAQLTGSGLMRIAAVAMSPVIIFSTAIDYYRITLPYLYLILFAINILYLIFAVSANTKNALANTKT